MRKHPWSGPLKMPFWRTYYRWLGFDKKNHLQPPPVESLRSPTPRRCCWRPSPGEDSRHSGSPPPPWSSHRVVFEDRHLEKSAATLPWRRRAAVVPPRPGWTHQLPAAVGQHRGQVSCRRAQPQELASSTAGSNGTTSSSTGSWPQPLPHLLRWNTGAALLTGGIGAATVYNLIGLGGHRHRRPLQPPSNFGRYWSTWTHRRQVFGIACGGTYSLQ
jgi:hypothetical protein